MHLCQKNGYHYSVIMPTFDNTTCSPKKKITHRKQSKNLGSNCCLLEAPFFPWLVTLRVHVHCVQVHVKVPYLNLK